MGKSKLNKSERAVASKKVAILYKEGMTIAAIARELGITHDMARNMAVKEGVFIPNRSAVLASKNCKERLNSIYDNRDDRKEYSKILDVTPWKVAEMRKQAIKPEDILDLRRKTKVGDKIMVMTEKAVALEQTLHRTTEYLRRATVVSTKNPRFCIVKFESTKLTEAILWADMLIANKKGKDYV